MCASLYLKRLWPFLLFLLEPRGPWNHVSKPRLANSRMKDERLCAAETSHLDWGHLGPASQPTLPNSWAWTQERVQPTPEEPPHWAPPKLPTHRIVSYTNSHCFESLSFREVYHTAKANFYRNITFEILVEYPFRYEGNLSSRSGSQESRWSSM